MKTKKFGSTFHAGRVHLGKSQEEIGNALGISQSKVSKIEDDKLEPSASEMVWLVDRLLGVDIAMSLEAVLFPAQLKIEQMAIKTEHRKGSHKGRNSHPGCDLCKSEKRP